MKCSKFVAKIADFEEAYRDTLTKKTQFVAEFWTFRQASVTTNFHEILVCILRLDYEQALKETTTFNPLYFGAGIFIHFGKTDNIC